MNLGSILLIFITIMVPNVKMGYSQRGSYEMIEGAKMYKILPADGIPALDDPKFKTVPEAEKFMNDDELVLGLVINGDARAYSTWHLDRHEIVNDYVGGVHVSVTW
ncbi:MAG: DUF3179 domain-containing protein [Candidatus Marinimicrobia bacterium]|nr:DUF3179 domain-containing protein [Candidatus Neomarinimicrobiota bacterium]